MSKNKWFEPTPGETGCTAEILRYKNVVHQTPFPLAVLKGGLGMRQPASEISGSCNLQFLCLFFLIGQITEAESLFNYLPGESTDSFSVPDHVPSFTDEVVGAADPAIIEACGGSNNTRCIFDSVQTNSTSVGLATLEFDESTQMDQMITSKINRIMMLFCENYTVRIP